jgi:hypothetical protein
LQLNGTAGWSRKQEAWYGDWGYGGQQKGKAKENKGKGKKGKAKGKGGKNAWGGWSDDRPKGGEPNPGKKENEKGA